MQFWERFLWFSKSIKDDICSALTLVRSSTEQKHWKWLVGEEVIKIPQPLYACLINSVTLWGCQLGAESLDVSELFSVHRLGAAAETEHVFITVCLSYALQNDVLGLKKGHLTILSRRVNKRNGSYSRHRVKQHMYQLVLPIISHIY